MSRGFGAGSVPSPPCSLSGTGPRPQVVRQRGLVSQILHAWKHSLQMRDVIGSLLLAAVRRDGNIQGSTGPCSSPYPLAVSAVPTGPNSTGAGDLWLAPQDTAAHHRPTADSRGDGLSAGHELGGGEASSHWALALRASSLAPSLTLCPWCSPHAPHPQPLLLVLPGRHGSGGQNCRRLGQFSPTTRPRLGEQSGSRARSEAVPMLGMLGGLALPGPWPGQPLSPPLPQVPPHAEEEPEAPGPEGV